MKITWDKNSDPYDVVAELIKEKYKYQGSILVQMYIKYEDEKNYRDITELLLEEGDYINPRYVWENDWWEGEQDIELIAAAPTYDLDISKEWAITE